MLMTMVSLVLSGCTLFKKPITNVPINTPTGNTNIPDENNLIRITTPAPNSVVSSPVTVSGEARGTWYFEASFPVRIVDAKGTVLGTGIAQAQDDWMTENFVPFLATITFTPTNEAVGQIIFQKDNPSGLPEHDASVSVPIRLAPVDTMSVQVYFGNSQKDPGALRCDVPYATTRLIAKTQAPARAALDQLLAGPTDAEAQLGFFTSLNTGVTIQKLTIENGVAKVDFNQALEANVGGSCRVMAIRAQIIQTLKQFPTVKDVVISINGRTEDILQP